MFVFEACRAFRFRLEPPQSLAADERPARNQFQGHFPPQFNLPRPMDHPHSAPRQLLDDLVIAENARFGQLIFVVKLRFITQFQCSLQNARRTKLRRGFHAQRTVALRTSLR